MRTKSLGALFLTSVMLPSAALAQLADGTYTTTDTTNGNTGSATASTGTSGTKFLDFEYTENPSGIVHVVKLAWNATAGKYMDNAEVANATKRWWFVTTQDGVRHYGYETKNADGTWTTKSSGTY